MIHPGNITGRTMQRGSTISGLTLTEHDDVYMYATGEDGCEWFADRTSVNASGPLAVMWEHRPTACPRCATFNVPMSHPNYRVPL